MHEEYYKKFLLLKTVRPSCRPSMDFPLESIELRCQSRVCSGRFRIDSGLFLNRLNLISNFPKKKFIPLAPTHLPRPPLKSIKIFDCEQLTRNVAESTRYK